MIEGIFVFVCGFLVGMIFFAALYDYFPAPKSIRTRHIKELESQVAYWHAQSAMWQKACVKLAPAASVHVCNATMPERDDV